MLVPEKASFKDAKSQPGSNRASFSLLESWSKTSVVPRHPSTEKYSPSEENPKGSTPYAWAGAKQPEDQDLGLLSFRTAVV